MLLSVPKAACRRTKSAAPRNAARCWQGWVVFVLALVAIVASFVLFPPNRQLVPFLAVHGGIVLVVLMAFLWKGEPLRRG